MIFGGVDRQRSHLFQTDPRGACWKYHAIALGSGSETVNALLEAKMTPNLTLDQAIQLAIGCLAQVIEGPIDATRITIITIPQVTARFTTLSDTEVTPYIQNTRS